MKKTTIHLGYEVGTGEPVSIPLRNMIVTGVTQEAGKTTAMEALIERANVKAVTFITKRGEQSFRNAHHIPPYFRERADWVFVSSLIDATMREKNKFIRSWLMKVCRGTNTLAEVFNNVVKAKDSARGFSESIYTEIEGYLELVVPQLKQLPAAQSIKFSDGINAVDLIGYSVELQALVIRSVMEHIHEHETGIVTVIPEAWEFVPEGRTSPVTVAAREILRKGSGIGNFLWFDSQDLRGIDKEFVGQSPVVLMGYQREANEIKRSLSNLHGVHKPKAGDIAGLTLGQFFASTKTELHKVYVQPNWMSDLHARAVATGAAEITDRPEQPDEELPAPEPIQPIESETDEMASSDEILAAINQQGNDIRTLTQAIIKSQKIAAPATSQAAPSVPAVGAGALPADLDAIYESFKARFISEVPGMFEVLQEKPHLVVTVTQPVFNFDSNTVQGKIVKMIADGFFDEAKNANAVFKELKRYGVAASTFDVYGAMAEIAALGAFTIQELGNKKGKVYQRVPDLKITKKDK